MWRQVGGEPADMIGQFTERPMITAPFGSENTELMFEVWVSDGVNISVDTVSVTVIKDGLIGVGVIPILTLDPEPEIELQVEPEKEPQEEPEAPASEPGGRNPFVPGDLVDDIETLSLDLQSDPTQPTEYVSADQETEPDTVERMIPSAEGRFERSELGVEREAAAVELELNMQLEQEEERRASEGDEGADDDGWRRWRTHEDQFEGRADEAGGQSEETPNLLSRMWVSLMVGLRSLFGAGGDEDSKR